MTVKVTLTNTAPADAADLPPYIASGNAIPKGQVRTNVLLYAPSGGRVDDVRVIGADQGVFSQTHNGLSVVGKTVQLKPGQRIVLTYDILTGKGQPASRYCAWPQSRSARTSSEPHLAAPGQLTPAPRPALATGPESPAASSCRSPHSVWVHVVQDDLRTLVDGCRKLDCFVNIGSCCARVPVAAVLSGIPGGAHPTEAGEIERRGHL